ncbi:MAG: UDP-glucose 4-epimerase GalE [Chloroflexi bacterium]|nr:UDP-glucose 4-epimerase GalE [Chloroflexota bacterium]
MRVLVTGGAGYIGAHVVRELIERGHRPVVLDNLSTGRINAVRDVELVVGDVGDDRLLTQLCTGHAFEAVMHFAALKSVDESNRDPARYFDVNVAKTVALLRVMHATGIGRLVYSSSAAVYGDPDSLPVNEEALLRPMNPYGETKRLVELMLRWMHESTGLRHAALRYFNAAGAREDASIGEDWTQATNLIPLVMKAVLRRGPPIKILGTDYPTPDGTAVRDYVHVVDLAAAHVLALERLADADEPLTVNLGTGQGSSVQEVIEATERISGRPVPAVPSARRIGDMPAMWADASRARELLGWRAERGLDDIIGTALRWHERQIGEEGAGGDPARA